MNRAFWHFWPYKLSPWYKSFENRLRIESTIQILRKQVYELIPRYKSFENHIDLRIYFLLTKCSKFFHLIQGFKIKPSTTGTDLAVSRAKSFINESKQQQPGKKLGHFSHKKNYYFISKSISFYELKVVLWKQGCFRESIIAVWIVSAR